MIKQKSWRENKYNKVGIEERERDRKKCREAWTEEGRKQRDEGIKRDNKRAGGREGARVWVAER